MTADERTIANAALGAGPWANHDHIVIAVADRLGLKPQHGGIRSATSQDSDGSSLC